MKAPVLVALGAALFVPCSSAAAPAGPSPLALMPLPRQELGRNAAGLVPAPDSGVDSNTDAARHAGAGVTAAQLARAGRIAGYTLDYRRPITAPAPTGHALLEVQTIAERYRNGAAARSGLAFWRGVTRRLTAHVVNGVSVGVVPFDAHLADGTFAFELTYRRGGRPIAYVGDIVFRTRALLGAVFVTAADRAGLKARTVALAHALATRIERVRAGKIRVRAAHRR